MKVISEKKNDLLKRKELEFEGEFDSNPGFEIVAQEIAEVMKVGGEVVVVRRIGSSFGSKNFCVDAFVYDNVDAKNRYEPKKKEKKKK